MSWQTILRQGQFDHGPQAPGRFTQPSLVRRQRPALFRPSLAHRADGLRPFRLRRQAGDRDYQHLERHQRLPHSLQATGRGGEARRVGGRRLPGRIAGDDSIRAVPEADDDDVSQFPRDGGGGGFALLPRRRRGADGRLRQDHAGAPHGRDLDEPSGDLHAGRPDAARQLARRGARLRQRRLEILGGIARRNDHREGLGGDRARHRPLPRALHDDGHRLDDDERRRGARHDVAGRGLDPRGRLRAMP